MFRFAIFLIFLGGKSFAQELARVSFTGGSDLQHFTLVTDGNLLIRISPDGRILEWGTEESSFRSPGSYAPRLLPYPGKVEYYGPNADSVSRGKVRSIGSAVITYFQAWETPDRVGKVRSAGRLLLDYYGIYDPKPIQGRLKYIGGTRLEFYSGFDDSSLQGKLKTVGSTQISYYSSFEDRYVRGRLRSIGTVQYNWYSSIDRQGTAGILKSGPYRQLTGGILYVLQ